MGDLLRIPAPKTGEVIEMAVEDLPDAASEMVDVLLAVQAPLSAWIAVAVAYFGQRKYAQFESMYRAMFAAGEPPSPSL